MVADGYKQTDVGVLPKGWGLKNFEKVFTFLTTATYSRADLSDDGDVQYLHYGDIHTKYDFTLDFRKHQLPYISNEQLKKYPLLKDGDIVMADASEDYNGICKSIEVINLENKRAIAGLHTFLLRDRNNTLVNGFKGYITASYLLKNQFDRLATGMKVYGVSKSNLLTVQIPIPPKPEQQAIATALSDTDKLINSLEKLISKKEAIKTGTMQELLTGKKRLDGFSGEWEEKTLGDYVSITSGDSPSKFSFYDKGMPYYKVEQLNYSSKYLIDNTPYFIENTAKRVSSNSIIFPKRGAAIFLNKIRLLASDAFFDTNLMALTTNDKLSHEFLFYVLDYIGLEHVADTTSVPQINNKHINPFVIPFPSLDEQLAIAIILSDMDRELDTLKIRLEKTKAIKVGMMQELLTGKTRLLQEVS